MRTGELRERVKLFRIKNPQGPHQIFNPSYDDVEPIGAIWAKREDKAQAARWGAMESINVMDKKQFIIRYRKDLPQHLAIEHDGKLYRVLAVLDLDNKRHWSMLLTGTVSGDESGFAF